MTARQPTPVFLALLLLCPAQPASPSTIHVPSDYLTVLAGVDAAVAGDTVLVAPGTYTYRETRTVPSMGHPTAIRGTAFLKAGITLLSEAGADSTILGVDSVSVAVEGVLILPDQSGPGEATVEGFTITGGKDNVAARARNAAGITLRSCVLRDIEKGISARHCNVTIENSVVQNLYPSWDQEGIWAETCDLDLESSVFRNNHGTLIRAETVTGGVHTIVRNCEFHDNKGGRVLHIKDQEPTTIERNLFIGNAAPSGTSGGCVDIADCKWVDVRYNTFVRDSILAPHGSGALSVSDDYATIDVTEIHNNTFYECYAGPEASCSAVGLHLLDVPFDFHSNAITNSRGAPALRVYRGDYQFSAWCNVFWNNEGGDYYLNTYWVPALTDFSINPQFCDPADLDFRVAASSPCLAGNSLGYCEQIGAHGEGCASFGTVVVGIETRPTKFTIAVDAAADTTPSLFNWVPESSHEVIVPSEVFPGPHTRYDFSHWEGVAGDTLLTIVTPSICTLYTAVYDTLHYLTMQADPGGTVVPVSAFHPRWSSVAIAPLPDTGHVFTGWTGTGDGSYTGADSAVSVTLNEPLTQTAHFSLQQLELRMVADSGGVVTPETGLHEIWSEVQIEATADPYYIFEEWVGNGEGSYSGTDNPTTVTMNEPITQGALFDRISHEVTLSLSDTDPSVSSGAPVGLGFVYLWLACSTQGGLKGFEGDVSGTMQVLAFTPTPGILNGGDATHLELASPACLVGPTLLGSLVVQDGGGGNLCLVPSASHGFLGGYDCTNPTMLVYEWPGDMRITGVATDGSAPCDSGRSCDEDATPDPVGVVEPTLEPITYDTVFDWSRPNPFATETELRFTLAQPTHVTLSIYDVAGRLVGRLLDEERGAGQHTVIWSGRDAEGRALPAGVYFSQLVAGDYVRARKLVLVRGK
jgi:uncharacterized repeat protein (TIGR02543 family)